MSEQSQHDEETAFSAETHGEQEETVARYEPVPEATAAPVDPTPDFEDLTLAQALGLFWRAPVATLRALAAVAQTPLYRPKALAEAPAIFVPPATLAPTQRVRSMGASRTVEGETALEFPRRWALALAQWLLRAVSLTLAIFGGFVMFDAPARTEQTGLDVGAPYLVIGFVVWLLSELLPRDSQPRNRINPQAHRRETGLVLAPARLIAYAGGAAASLAAWALNADNLFTLPGVLAWIASIVLWIWALAPDGWTPISGAHTAWNWLKNVNLRLTPTLLALVIIVGVGIYFRFVDLAGTPPEMTSDHVEKLLDVSRVLHGETNVFFANNHGRDAIQFYALALFSSIPGMHLDFYLLKFLTALEGVITLPVLWWMGREVIGKEEPKLGNAVGLTLAALVAVSFWHEMLSRLGLRIVLTPLFMALVIIFLVRAVRYNRRSDYLYTGLALGFGIYAYQALRMVPVVIVFTVGLALLFRLRGGRDRRYVLMNLAALVIVSVVIFVPLFRYAVDYPEDFWRRTSGRLFGDELTQTTDENGNLVMRTPSLLERVAAFNQNLPVLFNNFRNSILMFNWKGDVAWINNAPNYPAFDPLSGGLLIVGLAAWLGRMARRRDPFDWALIPLILIMMLPSSLSLAYPIENPSATRMSGTLPGVYLLAALPLALLALGLARLFGSIGSLLALVGASGLVFASYSLNEKTYFEDYRASYSLNSLPYSVGGQVLREFASTNGYGNAFILAYPYWWDHRALAIDAGRIDWANTILTLEEIPTSLQQAAARGDDLRLDVNKELFFLYSPDDLYAQQWLQENFPQGYWQNVATYQPGHSFNFYRVAALGDEAFTQFLAKYDLQAAVG